jgi:hypothetical protein
MDQRTKPRSSGAASISRLSNGFSSQRNQTKSAADFYSTVALSSRLHFAVSTRHSVTSRIHRNSRAFCYLIFSTRHLNATLENREIGEKFTTSPSLFCRFPPRLSPRPRWSPWPRLSLQKDACGPGFAHRYTQIEVPQMSRSPQSRPRRGRAPQKKSGAKAIAASPRVQPS